MGCTARYAAAWEYTGFWCTSAIKTGLDNGGGAGVAFLTDTQASFITFGVVANVGMTLYNLTTGLSGPITGVTIDTITATGVVWTNGNQYRVVAMTGNEQSEAELYLDITAADIHAALAASGACSCTLASWATNLLAKINIIEAGIFHTCPCANPGLSDAQRQLYLTWVNDQLDKIRDGRLEVCAGETGSDFPSITWAEQASTSYVSVDIVNNSLARTP
jgi:hypothetical protein